MPVSKESWTVGDEICPAFLGLIPGGGALVCQKSIRHMQDINLLLDSVHGVRQRMITTMFSSGIQFRKILCGSKF